MRQEERLRVLEGLLRKVEAAAERRGLSLPSRVPPASWHRSHAMLGQRTPPPEEGDMSDFDRNPTQELTLPFPEGHAPLENGGARAPGAPASRPLWASSAIGETLPDPRPSSGAEGRDDRRDDDGGNSGGADDDEPDSAPRALLTGPTYGGLDSSPPTPQNVSFQPEFVDEITSHGDPDAIEALVLKEAELAHNGGPARVEPARVEPARVTRTERGELSIPTEDDIFEMDEVGDDFENEDSRTTLPPDAPLDPPFDDDTGSDDGGAPMGLVEPPEPIVVTRKASDKDVVVELIPAREKTFLELLREAMTP